MASHFTSNKKTENSATQLWQNKRLFKPKVDKSKKPFVIIMPPPNITGQLHMGHVLNFTSQDILVRRAYMSGKNVFWVPGLDHASIATEAKVVKKLAKAGIRKQDISREEFLKHAWAWKKEYGGIILEQMKRLGLACDWDFIPFTMDQGVSKNVIRSFVELYKKGLIYREKKMINWDPVGKTALSDEEVYYKEKIGKLYHINYKIEGSSKHITIATTRPETIAGDTAIAINPTDKRYKSLIGKKAIVPIFNRAIPIIADEYVDPTFGTGCLKITPAHDINDHAIGQKHNLATIDIFNDDATLNQHGATYKGLSREEAAKAITEELKKIGCLEQEEKYTHKVGHSERTHAAIEPRLSTQWFCKMKTLAQPAIEAVEKEEICFHPSKNKNLYNHWMRNIKDWCISRQLWWGHQIPVYYLPDNSYIVAETIDLALQEAQKKYPTIAKSDLKQDPDVLDTWFSSWLWPMSVFDGLMTPRNAWMEHFYPTDDLVTGADIIFFWVARMIMAGYAFTGKRPFKNVYFTGIVRDKKRKKMSKSLGNSPDILKLMDEYGVDAVRVGILLCAPAGNDLLFDMKLCKQGKQFVHKLQNATKLITQWRPTEAVVDDNLKTALSWFVSRLKALQQDIAKSMEKYRISEALMILYRFVLHEFCGHYLEMIKPKDKEINAKALSVIKEHFIILLKLLHPFMPFTTDSIWDMLSDSNTKQISLVEYVVEEIKISNTDREQVENAKHAFELISYLRNKNKTNTAATLMVSKNTKWFEQYSTYITKATGSLVSLAEATPHHRAEEEQRNKQNFAIDGVEFTLYSKKDNVSREECIKKWNELLQQKKKLLLQINNKLNNPKFCSNVPKDVLVHEKKKKTDTEVHIKTLLNNLDNIN